MPARSLDKVAMVTATLAETLRAVESKMLAKESSYAYHNYSLSQRQPMPGIGKLSLRKPYLFPLVPTASLGMIVHPFGIDLALIEGALALQVTYLFDRDCSAALSVFLGGHGQGLRSIQAYQPVVTRLRPLMLKERAGGGGGGR